MNRAFLAAVALVLGTAACGGSDHNEADVEFATSMIPHHRQAVEMADLADDRASSAKVKSLAGKIEKAQDPEIEKMSGWLKSWDEPVPKESDGMDHSGHGGMSGMMSPEDMDALENSSGKGFDRMFLTMMVEHHRGAVTMAKTEQKEGSYEPAQKMAKSIQTSQTREIAEMKRILGK